MAFLLATRLPEVPLRDSRRIAAEHPEQQEAALEQLVDPAGDEAA